MKHALRPLCSALAAAILLVIFCDTALAAPKKKATTKPEPIAIAEIKHDGKVDFAKEVLPILTRHCLACHNATTHENSLVLETPQTILKGGDAGAAVAPGKSGDSLLLKAAARQIETAMPPEDNDVGAKPMSPEELGLIKLWIDQGAAGEVNASNTPVKWQPLPPGVNPIYAVAVSPDGQYAAGGRANQIFVYHLPSGRLVTRLTDPGLISLGLYKNFGVAHLDLVQSLAFSPDGDLLASGGYREVKLWRRPHNVHKVDLAGATEAAQVVAVSPNGKWSATGQANGEIKIWNMANGKPVKSLAGHSAAVTSLRILPDSKTLISGSLDKTIRIWNAAEGTAIAQIATPSPINALAMLGDDGQLASGGADNLIRLWTLPTSPPRDLAAVPAAVTAMIAGADKKTAALAAADGKIYLVDVVKGEVIKTLAGRGAAIVALSLSADGNRLATAEADGSVRVWDVARGEVLLTLRGSIAAASAVALHPGGNQVVSGTADGKLTVWKLDVQPPAPLAGELEVAPAVAAMSLDGRLLAVAGTADGKPAIVIRDVAAGTVAKTIVGPSAAVTAIAFSPDASKIAAGTADNSLKIWNTADGAEVKNFAGHAAAVVGVTFNTSGQTLVSASADKTIRLWNTADGNQVRAIEQPSPISSVALSRDDARIAVGLADGTLKLLQLADGKELANLVGHKSAVQSAAFSADGQRLASGAARQAIVWDVSGGGMLEEVSIENATGFVAFAAAPNELLVGSADKKIYKHALHLERPLPSSPQQIVRLYYKPDGNLVYAASQDGLVRGLQVASAQQAFAANHGAPVHDLALSPDGKWLATTGEDQQVRIWNAEGGGPGPKPQLGGFTAPAHSVCFSGDSQKVIAASTKPQEIIVFNLATGAAEQFFTEHAGAVGALCATGDAQPLVVSAANKTVKIWPLVAGMQIAGHSQPVTALAASPADKSMLFSGSADGSVRQWNLQASGQQVRQMDHGGPVAAIAVRADGKQLASAGGSNLVRLWNSENGQPWVGPNNQPVPEMKGDLRAQVAVASLERTVARVTARVADAKKSVTDAEARVTAAAEMVKAVATAKETAAKTLAEKIAAAKPLMETKAVADAALAAATEVAKAAAVKAMETKAAAEKDPNNADLAKGRDESQKAATDADNKKKEAENKVKETAGPASKAMQEVATAEAAMMAAEQAMTATATASQRATEAVPVAQAAAAGAEAALTQTQGSFEEAKKNAAAQEKPIRSLAYSADGSQLASGGENQLVRTWSAEIGAPIDTFAGHQGPVLSVAYGADGSVVSSSADKSSVVWDPTAGWTLERTIGNVDNGELLVDRVLALAFSPDGKLLATGGGEPSRSGELKLWNVADGTLAKTIADAHSDTIFGLEFSPDGVQLASSAADRFAKVFDVASGKLSRAFEGHTHHVLDVAWKSDGKLLASCGADNVIKVWDVASGEQKLTTQPLPKEVTSIAFVADTPRMLITSGDRTARIYNAENGGNEKTFSGGADFLYTSAVTPDGKIVIAGGQESILFVWNADSAQLIRSFEPPKTNQGADVGKK